MVNQPYSEPSRPDNPALAAWADAGLRAVTLPSGTEVRIRLVPIEQLVKRGLIPSELTKIAMSAAMGGFSTAELTEDEFRNFMKLVDELVCRMLRDLRTGTEADGSPTWTPITLTPAMLDEFELPGDDLDQLGLIAIRRTSAELVTLESKINRGIMPAEEAEGARKEAETASDSTGSFSRFHSGPGVPPPGADGADVRAAAVKPVGDQRPGRRARLRSSGSGSTSRSGG